ncbi:hypothetical protein PInf_014358 [Phytophthora infestans]|nr:hypothetical protein PInf_014358 [Phytophthora infestans]
MERVAVDMDDNFTTISSREAYTQLYRVLHVVSSPEVTVISYRRAPLDQLQAAQAHAAAQLATQQSLQQVKGEPLGLQAGGASPSTQRVMGVSGQMLPQSVYSPAHNASVMPIAHAHDVSLGSGRSSSRLGSLLEENPLNEAKRQRQIPPTRSSDQGMIHALQDKLIWEHVNAPAVAVSKNMALLLTFVRWAPVRLYAPLVDELVSSIKLKLLDTSRTNPKKANNLDCFSRLLLQHAHVEESVRAAGSGPLPLELETLLRVASQTVLWLFSHETLGWFREFFRLNAALTLDKKAIRSCFIQFLHELEEHLNTKVLAASTLHSLTNMAEQILSGQSFAGWNMFVAQMRDIYIGHFQLGVPPHNAVERNWNGEWLLDTDGVQWDINEASSSPGRKMDADPSVPNRLASKGGLFVYEHRKEWLVVLTERMFRMLPNGMSTGAGMGSHGDYFGEMRVEAPGQLILFLEMFNWSLEEALANPLKPKETRPAQQMSLKLSAFIGHRGQCGVLLLDDTVTSAQEAPLGATDGKNSTLHPKETPPSIVATPLTQMECGAADDSPPSQARHELEQLSQKAQADSTELHPESARKRRKIDRLIDKFETDDNDDWCIAIVAMEERNGARQLVYRRERDAQDRQDELRLQAQDERREERERLRDERFLALVAEIAKTRDWIKGKES